MRDLTTPEFLDLVGISDMDLRNANHRYRLPFEGTRGKMRAWSEADYLLWCVFQQLKASHGAVHSVRVAQEIAAFAASEPEANEFVVDHAAAWFAVKPNTTVAEIRKHWNRPVHLHLINIEAQRIEYRRAARTAPAEK